MIYDFRPVISNTLPGAQAPRIEATFTDIDPGKVLLTVTAMNLAGGESLGDLYFNFDPVDNMKQLHFTRLSSPAGSIFSKISTGEDSFQLGGYGNYDIRLSFGKAGGRILSNGVCVTYQIVGPELDVSDFAFVNSSVTRVGSYYALARVRENCGGSQWLACSSPRSPQPVPEPISLAFLVYAAGTGYWLYLWGKRMKRTRSLS